MKYDAIMVGRQTALIDNPRLTVRHIKGKNPIRVILDTHRKLPLKLNVFNDNNAETIVLCSKVNFEKRNTSFSKYIPVEEDESGKLSPYDILDIEFPCLTNFYLKHMGSVVRLRIIIIQKIIF